MFTAAFLAASLVAVFTYRKFVYAKVRKTKWYNSYYIFFTIFQLYFCIHDLVRCYVFEIEDLDFLTIPPTLPDDLLPDDIKDLELTTPLAILSMCAPISVIVTTIITLVHMWQHHKKILETENALQDETTEHIKGARYPHDLCILVLLLPLVYSLMAFKSVSRMWMLMTGTVYTDKESYDEAKQLEMAYYETNYYVADLYEAIGLYSFSRLCVGSVRNVCMQGNWGETAQKLFVPLKKMTLFGVEAFAGTYAVIAIYHLTLSISESFGYDICDKYPVVCTFDGYTVGAGFLASTLAIYNIISFEHNLEHYLKDFQPTWKFWGAKVLVSLAFMQNKIIITMLVDWIKYYSLTQGQLFYSSLMCIECVFVALLHMYAWNADAEWYRDPLWQIPLDFNDITSHKKVKKESLTEPFLQDSGR